MYVNYSMYCMDMSALKSCRVAGQTFVSSWPPIKQILSSQTNNRPTTSERRKVLLLHRRPGGSSHEILPDSVRPPERRGTHGKTHTNRLPPHPTADLDPRGTKNDPLTAGYLPIVSFHYPSRCGYSNGEQDPEITQPRLLMRDKPHD